MPAGVLAVHAPIDVAVRRERIRHTVEMCRGLRQAGIVDVRDCGLRMQERVAVVHAGLARDDEPGSDGLAAALVIGDARIVNRGDDLADHARQRRSVRALGQWFEQRGDRG